MSPSVTASRPARTIITYDVPSVEAAGRNPIVPVVVMEKKPEDIVLADLVAARRAAWRPRS